MNIFDDEVERLRRSAEAEILDRLFATVGVQLHRTLATTFRMPPKDAEDVVQDVFSAYVTAGPRVADTAGWLRGAALQIGKSSAESYAMCLAITAPPPDATAEETRAVQDGLFTWKAVRDVPESGREALRLRFQEHRTFREIADELKIATFYAEKLIAKSLAILRKHHRAAGTGTPHGEKEEESRSSGTSG